MTPTTRYGTASWLAIIFAIATSLLVSASESNASTLGPINPSRSGAIQASGLRTGSEGTNFFSAANKNNGAFSSYGLLDFSNPSLGIIVASFTSITLTLFDAPAPFSAAASLGFYFVTDSTTDYSNFTFVSDSNTPDNLAGVDTSQYAGGTQFIYLGSGTYTPGSAGTAIPYVFNPDATASSAITSAVNSGSSLRFLITPDNASVATEAARYTGFANPTPPELTGEYTAVPEPTTLVLIGFSVGGLVLVRRRRASITA